MNYYTINEDSFPSLQHAVKLESTCLKFNDHFIIEGYFKYPYTLEFNQYVMNEFNKSKKTESKVGVGPKNVLDKSLRNSTELIADEKIAEMLQPLTKLLTSKLNMVLNTIKLIPYKIVQYDENGHFVKHRDSSHSRNQIGTVSYVVYQTGPYLCVYDDNGKIYTDQGYCKKGGKFMAFHKHLEHEVKKFSGTRIVILYDICMVDCFGLSVDLTQHIFEYADHFYNLRTDQLLKKNFDDEACNLTVHKNCIINPEHTLEFKKFVTEKMEKDGELYISPTTFFCEQYDMLSSLDSVMLKLIKDLGYIVEFVNYVVNRKTIIKMAKERSKNRFKFKKVLDQLIDHEYKYYIESEYESDTNEASDTSEESESDTSESDSESESKTSVNVKYTADHCSCYSGNSNDHRLEGSLPNEIYCFTELSPILTVMHFKYKFYGNHYDAYWEKPVFTIWKISPRD